MNLPYLIVAMLAPGRHLITLVPDRWTEKQRRFPLIRGRLTVETASRRNAVFLINSFHFSAAATFRS
jgi:hypothetical protein